MDWDNLSADRERQQRLPGFSDRMAGAVTRTFDAPEAMGINFHEIRARSVLNPVPKQSRMRFRFTINAYRGCTHACPFCFARATHPYLGFDAGRDFEREIVVKVNAPEVVRAELARPSWKRELVAMGTNTDPYQWAEGRYRLMPGILEALRDSRTPASILTKSPLAMRDLDLYREIAEAASISVSFTVATLDERAWRASEPHTPHPRKRLEAVAELNRAGIPSGVMIAPLMPGINDRPEQVARIVELADEARATHVTPIALHLRGEVRDVFFEWLRGHRPELVSRYEKLFGRGAYMENGERRRPAGLARQGAGGTDA